MWLVRRATLPTRLQGPWLEVSGVISAKSDILSSSVAQPSGTCRVEKEHFAILSASERFCVRRCGYCSDAGLLRERENRGLEDSEIQVSPAAEFTEELNRGEEELCSEMELFEGEDEKGASSGDLENLTAARELLYSIRGVSGDDVFDVCNKWAKQGNKLSEGGISFILSTLHYRRLFWKALKFSEWLGKSKQIDLMEKYYASHLGCISKFQSLCEVEKFFDDIPESFKGELVYRNLLKSCVHALKRKKAEAVLKKMSDLDLPITIDAYNLMILLYKRVDKERIASILSIMEKCNVNPSHLTYKLLIDAKGESGDMSGMENLVEAMKADGIEPNVSTLATMAKHYISSGYKVKAYIVLEKIEDMKQEDIVLARGLLLHLYASLGRDDKVRQIWKDCESEPTAFECLAAIKAWGKMSKVEEAESVFDVMGQKLQLSSWHYSSLLQVYVDNKLPTKAKDLVKQMTDAGCYTGPVIWDILVRLYVEAGEVKKADSVLLDAIKQKNGRRPLFRSYITVMEQYAKRGDVFNTEKLFARIKGCGYVVTLKVFELLAQAYITAKAPAYGFRDRMRANNTYPNAALSKQVALLDVFRRKKTVLSDLHD